MKNDTDVGMNDCYSTRTATGSCKIHSGNGIMYIFVKGIIIEENKII